MELLTRKIEERLAIRQYCRVFRRDLDRVWPMSGKEEAERDKRLQQITQYADSHGWSVDIFDPGVQATFRRKV